VLSDVFSAGNNVVCVDTEVPVAVTRAFQYYLSQKLGAEVGLPSEHLVTSVNVREC